MKKMMVVEENNQYALSGKTGWLSSLLKLKIVARIKF